MNLRALEYLVAVADRRSFRRAATACGVSQPTLSVQVRKLEEELGVELVDRSAIPLSLTPAGTSVVERARTILAEAAAIRLISLELHDSPAPIRLGVFPTLGPYLLPHVSAALRTALPRLLLTEEKSSTLAEWLCAGELDAAVLALPVDDPQLEQRPLFREDFVVVAPAGHPLANTTRVTRSSLVGRELVLLSDGHCLKSQVRDWAAANGAVVRNDYCATSLESLRHTLLTDGGVTLLPALTVLPPVVPTPGLIVRRFAGQAPFRDVALVWPRTSPHRRHLRALAPLLVPPASECHGLLRPL
ncbi:LysR substrate-binding domain-containing protein [Buchananella hordeovulneris]|uniref:Probable hydrogen peroxide-inducible genes activator n=1 Tax=Buchananella hordeovulneris TaxID=52770 RepID=A0A1Q5PY70_9ACTO|nr:LysR substrate-binding domain-containing protein [Buchananella hordeovulneris]MDO5079712.1 LysR substrate-binding domain-containing protein [Buchananella hordeovulneris]OKL52385.1 hypothetical protein BSZ40_02585 [Buchananella hordeovulneris]RRD45426.1 LysR family transcriptional regulator [Buchananella hordeovulneris]RRD53814.1 LysR family transcriptional regulator [Buchananella hordeovulneris]